MYPYKFFNFYTKWVTVQKPMIQKKKKKKKGKRKALVWQIVVIIIIIIIQIMAKQTKS